MEPIVVIPPRFERGTPRLGIWCSILLSYGTDSPSIQKTGHEAKGFRAIRATGRQRNQPGFSTEGPLFPP